MTNENDIPPMLRHPMTDDEIDAARIGASPGRHLNRALDEIERLKFELEQTRTKHDRLVAQAQVYMTNHGERCDGQLEHYATIAESACRMLTSVRERLKDDRWTTATGWSVWSDINTFLSLPSHEVPGLRAQVAARDASIDAHTARIAEVLRERDEAIGSHSFDKVHWEKRFTGLAMERDDLAGLLHGLNEVVSRWATVREQWRAHDYVGMLDQISERALAEDPTATPVADLFRAINDAVEGNEPREADGGAPLQETP